MDHHPPPGDEKPPPPPSAAVLAALIDDNIDAISFTSTTPTHPPDSTSSSSTATPSHASWSSASSRPHRPPPCDVCWRRMVEYSSAMTLSELRFVHRLGSGDIGCVYLVEVKGGDGCLFAAKVMDMKEMASRNKESRARVEREILEVLDHPFLPALYATVESPTWSCLLTEFCPGGDLHSLRQDQPERRFNEFAVRFYASEVVAAFEYLHMMGIIYRDLKPENVLVRSDGHIMLTDFDLSLKDDATSTAAQIVCSLPTPPSPHPSNVKEYSSSATSSSGCTIPNCISHAATAASCFHANRNPKKKKNKNNYFRAGHHGAPEIVAEPVDVRSMSFVGTHEYLAPEVVAGDGHGSEVDWWTLGIFVYEMFYGVTPFKGCDHESTLASVVARALEFPREPAVPGPAKDLIAHLLIKDPARRLGSTLGAMAIKHHPFFDGVNWALLRCRKPPFVPRPFDWRKLVNVDADKPVEYY
ncbi:unnamed protein product [Linum trigynum]|uniref:non-specific serine/threonine protein kinase n=1 Tax=Linum trigynum TaxID=586398 RepID=A0AAV2DJM2_9ROSI